MVLVIAQHNLPKPCTGLAGTVMLPALKFSLNRFQLRHHSLLCRNPSDGKSSAAIALPTVVDEAQKREGLRFPSPTLLSVLSGFEQFRRLFEAQ
jgi:hypothetical protein